MLTKNQMMELKILIQRVTQNHQLLSYAGFDLNFDRHCEAAKEAYCQLETWIMDHTETESIF